MKVGKLNEIINNFTLRHLDYYEITDEELLDLVSILLVSQREIKRQDFLKQKETDILPDDCLPF
jgi:hypothetical protein